MGARLEVKVDGNSSGFKHTMDSIRTQSKAAVDEISHSWTRGITSAVTGLFAIDTVKSAVQSFISSANQIKDMADSLDMSTDATQKWAKAADEVGQNLQSVYGVMSAIQSMRQQALRDPKAADLFNVLGISRDEVLNEDNSEFAKRVLTAGGASADNRKILEQIIGRRGLRMIPAASRFSGETPDYAQSELKAAKEADKAQTRAYNFVGRIVGFFFTGIARSIDVFRGKATDTSDFFKPAPDSWYARHHPGVMAQLNGTAQPPKQPGGDLVDPKRDPILAIITRLGSEIKTDADIASYVAKNGIKITDAMKKDYFNSTGSQFPDLSAYDPLAGIISQQEKEFQLRKEEAQLSLHEAERRNMTIAARKESIAQDIKMLNGEISERQKAQREGRIYGMTLEQQNANMLPSDIKKQLQQDQLTLLGLQGQKTGLTNELRDNRNFGFTADSMARVGLYSASTLRINPIIGLNQRQLHVLENIERNTAQHTKDPHRR